MSQSYKRYGVHREGEAVVYREWAPEAQGITIFGDFNGWKRGEYSCEKVFGRLIRMDLAYGPAQSTKKSNLIVPSKWR